MVKMKSHISQNKETGAKALIVYYDKCLDNFSQAIESGLTEHGLKHGEVNVIAFPKTMKSMTPNVNNDHTTE
jgi:hypothetical protein